MFRFAHIEYLYGLILIPVLTLVFIYLRYRNRRNLARFGDPGILRQLMPLYSGSRAVLRFILLMLALAFLSFTLARPQFGSKLQEVKRKGVELVIALDVSNSMLAEDIQPSRLERAKQAISKLVDRLENDRIGLIVFAGDAYVQVPITSDYISAKLFLETVGPDMVPKQGTAIGSAIELAMNSFTPEAEKNRVILIISDGENHEDDAIATAEAAREKGIVVHTLGMGKEAGVPIPVSPGSNVFRKDNRGQVVITKMEPRMLARIAGAGGGKYFPATASNAGFRAVLDEINKMEKQEMETRIYSEYNERFQFMAGAALLFLILEVFILERKNRWLNSIKLFGND